MLIRNNKFSLLTQQEKEIIRDLLKKEMSARGIANILGRAKNTILEEIRRGGGRENYHPSSFQYLNRVNSHELSIRVSNLEMQVEILMEYLKEKNAAH